MRASPSALGRNVTLHVPAIRRHVPPCTSVPAPVAAVNVPVPGGADGTAGPGGLVSVTVAVHVDAKPTGIGLFEHDTPVAVVRGVSGSTPVVDANRCW